MPRLIAHFTCANRRKAVDEGIYVSSQEKWWCKSVQVTSDSLSFLPTKNGSKVKVTGTSGKRLRCESHLECWKSEWIREIQVSYD